MTQFLQAFYKRVIARDRLNTPIRIDEISATITHVCNCDLLPNHQCSSQRGAATGCFLLDGALSIRYSSLHDLLKGFLDCFRFYLEQKGMEFAHDITGNTAYRCVAGHFTELMSTHTICHNI